MSISEFAFPRHGGLPLLMLCCLTAIACGDRHAYESVRVRVIDGETGKPITNTEVRVRSGDWRLQGDSATTDDQGYAEVRRGIGRSQAIYAVPAGYLPSAGHFPAQDKGHDVDVLVFKPPTPITGIRVPAKFRGVFAVHNGELSETRRPRPASPKGQREFYTPLNPAGVTKILPPPRLMQSQPYEAAIHCGEFDDGTPLRFENPIASTGTSGEYLSGLPDLRDRVPPRPDGVALFELGLRIGQGNLFARLYFVGTRAEAEAEQQKLVADSVERTPNNQLPPGKYAFTPRPLSIDQLEVGTQLTPRQPPPP